jgi:hypothetical protein
MRSQGLKYYMHDGPTAFRFELAGDLNGEGARRLEQDWRTAWSTLGDRRLIIDMTFVTGVDEQGSALIARWRRDGASFMARSKASRALAEAILGEALPEPSPRAGAARYCQQVPSKCSTFQHSFRRKAPHLLEFIDFGRLESHMPWLKRKLVEAKNPAGRAKEK